MKIVLSAILQNNLCVNQSKIYCRGAHVYAPNVFVNYEALD